MAKGFGRRIFSRNYLFASFFGAAMIAASFAYFNYKFSTYKFIDFNQMVFFSKRDVFKPVKEEYMVLVYHSKGVGYDEIAKSISTKAPILAVDLYQNRFLDKNNTSFVTSEMNVLLKFIQRFNIYEVPSAFFIKKVNGNLYKQDSATTIIRR